MTQVALFHHILGITDGLRRIAVDLQALGHSVQMVDLFDGETFESIDAGVAHLEEVGFESVIDRGADALAADATDVVVVGISLGVLPAQKLVQTHPGVVGAVLIDGAVEAEMFGDWPVDKPVQIHMVDGDELAAEDLDAAKQLAAEPNVSLTVHHGSGHLVIDTSAADHNRALATPIVDSLCAFVSGLDPRVETGRPVDAVGRIAPPAFGDEAETLLGYLDYQRCILAWKVRGLDATGMRATTAASTMTLGGLLMHMAYVEDHWSARVLWDQGKNNQPPWDTVDWQADGDWEWNQAHIRSPEDIIATWRVSVDRSDRLFRRAVDEFGLGGGGREVWPDGQAPSVRWILTHVIEEYARHIGHADLLREAVDGATGE
jgi:dienelactone hydrolase/uncharacterized damage-inducible protein DinB